MKIYGRDRWGPVGTRGTRDGRKRELFIHHSAGTFGGPAKLIDSLAEQATVMRAIDRFHKSRGWAGVGYNYVVFQPYGPLKTARVFEGRGASYIPAAQQGHNTGTIAICVIDGGHGEPLKDATKQALFRLAKELKATKNIVGVGGHRDAPGQSTSCPGGFIYPALDDIAKRAGLKRIRR